MKPPRMTHPLLPRLRVYHWLLLFLIPLLINCGNSQVAAVGSGGTSKIGGHVATGAAVVGAVVTLYDASGQTIAGPIVTDAAGAYAITLNTDQAKPPFLLRAQIGPQTYYHALLLSQSSNSSPTVNIHQVSELVSALALGQDPRAIQASSFPAAADLAVRYQQAVTDVSRILSPVTNIKAAVAGQNASEMVASSLNQPMQTNNLGSDALLDAIDIDKTVNTTGTPTYTLKVNGETAHIPPIDVSPTPKSVAAAIQQANSQSYQDQVNASALLQSAPVTVFYGEESSSRATLAIWLPTQITGGWVLTFDTAYYSASAFSGVFAEQTQTTAPNGQALNQISLSSLNSNTHVANTVLGARLASSSTGVADIRNCRFNGNPCAVRLFQANQTNSSFQALLQAYGQAQLFTEIVNKVASVFASPPAPTPVPPDSGPVITNTGFEVTLELLTEWVGGYGAEFRIKNVSGADIAANQKWQVLLSLPQNLIDSGPWNLDATFANNTYTLTPKNWVQAQVFVNQTTVVSGFNGAGCALSLSTAAAQNAGLVIGPKLQQRLQNTTPCP